MAETNSRKSLGKSNTILLGGITAAACLMMVGIAIALVLQPRGERNREVPHPPKSSPTLHPASSSPAVSTQNNTNVANTHTDAPFSLGEQASAAIESNPSEAGAGSTTEIGPNDRAAETETDKIGDELIEEAPDIAPPVVPAQPAKAQVPEKSARDAMRAKIDGLFPPKEADTSDKQIELANQMLAVANDSESDPVAKFVLINMARELAAKNAQIHLALHAVDLLEASFEFDPEPVRLATLDTAIRSQIAPAEKREVVLVGLEVVGAMFAHDEYEAAGNLIISLLEIVRRSRDKVLLETLLERRAQADELLQAYNQAKHALEVLKTDSENPGANLIAGRFLLLDKQDWPKALPLLAKSSDNELSNLASAELQGVGTAIEEEKLAEGWWARAEAETDKKDKKVLQARALAWYQRAEPGLNGLAKVKAQKCINELVDAGIRPTSLVQDSGKPENPLVTFPIGEPPATSSTSDIHLNIKKSVESGSLVVTPLIGKEGALNEFRDESSSGGLLAGVKVSTGRFGVGYSHSAVASIQGLFLTPDGIVAGKTNGPVKSDLTTFLAKEGYAVGGMRVQADTRVRGIQLIFMRITGNRLDPKDYYLSPSYLTVAEDAVLAGGNGMPIVGIHGGWAKQEVRGLGLIQLPLPPHQLQRPPAPAGRNATGSAMPPAGINKPAATRLIPQEAMQFGGHSYFVFAEGLLPEDAEKLCNDRGGYLVRIDSEEEQQFIVGLIHKAQVDAHQIWIGGTDQVTEGAWVHYDGSKMNYTNWAPESPNNVNNEDYACMLWYTPKDPSLRGRWDDKRGDGPKAFVCEWAD